MKIVYSKTADELGKKAANHTAELLRRYIETEGSARLLLSTGASQFATLNALIEEPVDWNKVEMFHLDEYLGITQDHPASFVRYLQERFTSKVQLKKAHFVDTSGDINKLIAKLTEEINKKPIHVGCIGIGENSHIAFNDPPADFDNENAFIIVTLAESCRKQQLGEGWFPAIQDVPEQAVTITAKQILKCKHIISAVPYKVKAQAIYDTLKSPGITPMVPSTILRNHEDVTIYIDEDSSSMIDVSEFMSSSK